MISTMVCSFWVASIAGLLRPVRLFASKHRRRRKHVWEGGHPCAQGKFTAEDLRFGSGLGFFNDYFPTSGRMHELDAGRHRELRDWRIAFNAGRKLDVYGLEGTARLCICRRVHIRSLYSAAYT